MMVPRFTSRMGLYWEAKRCPLLWIFVAKGGMMERNFVERLLILKRVFVSLDQPLSAEALIEPPVEVPATNVFYLPLVIVPSLLVFCFVEDYENPDLTDVVPKNVTPGPEGKENIDASTRGDLAFSKLDDEARDAVLIFPFASCFLLLLALACFSLLHAAVPKLIPYIHSFSATSTSAVLNMGIPISAGMTPFVPSADKFLLFSGEEAFEGESAKGFPLFPSISGEPSNDSVVVETSDFSQHEINSMPDGPSDPFHHPVNVDNNIQDWGRSFELSIVLFPHVVIDPMDIRPNRLRSGLVSFRSFHLSFSDSFFPALV
ncbi:hypothetical protein Tco_0768004 [Tanacetum coccineum]